MNSDSLCVPPGIFLFLSKTVFLGRIINIESLDCKFLLTAVADPDESFWMESAKKPTYFLTTVRVFYKRGPPAYETIGKGITITSKPQANV